ncbi:glycerophosphoryl diester phosphodiesterase membrane domain-containing protein [Streptomyces sp. NPDC047928]|uniref:glycerophosphoryl diester phosphodiesterase membrane domain-containing protein n=1 Tax=unclassified Streptomyces TaxID=2593676 RepID=UPI00370FB5A0
MNDTPGWASPGSSASDGQGSGQQGPDTPAPSTPPADERPASPQWSKEQPPASQWSAPAGPGSTGPARQPAPHWGNGPRGGWGAPPTAKPGVIPLRPLGVGEILDGAVSTLRAHWRTVLSVTITVSVITQTADTLLRRFVLPTPPRIDSEASPSEQMSQLTAYLRGSLLAESVPALITLMATFITTALLTIVVSRSVLGRPVTLADAWREARPRLLQLLGLTLLLAALTAGILAVGIAPGLLMNSTGGDALASLGGIAAGVVAIWLMIRFSLSYPALMLERGGVLSSLRRSAKLVRGSWWRIFGILLLTMLLAILIMVVIAIPFSIIGFAVDGEGVSSLVSGNTPDFGWPFLIVTGIGAVIASSVTYPISAGVTVLLYVDQRIRREALDLELARAAGVPGYGASSGDTTSGS